MKNVHFNSPTVINSPREVFFTQIQIFKKNHDHFSLLDELFDTLKSPIPLPSSSLHGFSRNVNNDDLKSHFLGSLV